MPVQNERLRDILDSMEKPIARIDLTVGLIHSEIRAHIEGICSPQDPKPR